MFARIRFALLALCAIAWSCALAPPAAAQCPAKTTVADTLYNADGSLASGRVTIAWPTFLIGSCQVISGQTTITVLNGALSVQLYTNTSATPAGTSFRVTFALKSGRITTEYWVVPASATPVMLAAVRSPTVPVPAVMFAEAQVTNLVADLAKKLELPSPCPAGKVLESNGSGSPPQLNCVDPLSGSGVQHQVNGVNLASSSPVNFQDSTSIAFANSGAGNVQAGVADGAVTAAKLAVSSPSAVQLAGIGDNNIAPSALSPNRILGTAVAQTRTINTTSPLTGGGDLSANRTIACPTCVTSISGTANEISATGSTAPTLSLPSIMDLSSKTLKGSTPLVLDGATADSNKTTVVVTDPTAARNFTLPNADSVAVQALTCSGTDKVSAVSALGVVTCTADQTGGGSAHNLLSATHSDTVAASPVLGDVLFANSTPAWDKLAGNTTATKKYLSQTGNATISAAPVWSQPAFSEISGSVTDAQVPDNITITLATTATALAADPADCSANQFANAINASGTLTCAALTLAGAQFANQGTTVTLLHGNASGNPSWGAVVEADITLADNSTNNVSSSAHGFFPKLSGAGLVRSSGSALSTAELSGVVITSGSNATTPGKADVMQTSMYCSDAGATDTYACSLSPAITAYVTGTRYIFKANTANTGAASINFNGVGALTIVKLQAAITTTLADNDIRAGQWVVCIYDGTNCQMESQVGNIAPTATALAANGANCSAGQAPLGVDASGAAESCFAVSTSSSTDTFTNKTYDVEATGNVFSSVSKIYLDGGICQNTTAGTSWDLPVTTPAVATCVTGTNIQKGVLAYADTAGGFIAQYTLGLPADWTTATLPDVDIYWTTTATSGNAKWTVSFVCTDVAASATDDPAFPTSGNGFNTVTTAAPGTGSRVQTSTITAATVPASCATGTKKLLHIRLFRDGNDAADTIAATANVVGVMLSVRRAQ